MQKPILSRRSVSNAALESLINVLTLKDAFDSRIFMTDKDIENDYLKELLEYKLLSKLKNFDSEEYVYIPNVPDVSALKAKLEVRRP